MKRKSRNTGEIYPDEIFLDARNMPTFNTQQFEGRIEKPISQKSLYTLAAFFLLAIIFIGGKLFTLQINQGQAFYKRSLVNTLRFFPVFPERSSIKDKNGTLLAWNNGSERNYMEGGGFSHLLGYLGQNDATTSDSFIPMATTTVGIDGVEKIFNTRLAGTPGIKITETDALGHTLSESVQQDPISGQPLVLSIDAKVQQKLYEIIKAVSTDRGFAGGAGIIMNVETGELVAITSYPEFSSLVFSAGNDRVAINQSLRDPAKPFLDRAVSGLYAPGSIIKPFMAIGALTEGIISPDKKILSTGQLVIPNPYDPEKPTIFKDWEAHGWINMRQGIEQSSDEYFYQIGGGYKDQRGLGITNIEKYARMFGFGEPTKIEFADEKMGNIPSPEWKAKTFPKDAAWRVGNTYHTVIGQYGFLVTPIQAVRAVAALATNGKLVRPTILQTETPEIQRTIDLPQANFNVVKEGMRMSAVTGTGKGLNLDYLKVATKTGTAELGVSKSKVNSWVVGFFPYEHPKYAFTIVMEAGPVHNTIGGVYVMRQLFDWMFWHAPEYIKS
ncbi:MAG: penicillin-binding transpeptidase domain-containing protein [Candidatus Paceibacterota bacterium]|jgi:penicillin-binding protein 2